MEFKCNKCGACCRNVNLSETSSFLDRGDGVCKYYDEKVMCKIYDFRPEICDVEKMYKKYKEKISHDEYVKLTYDTCDELRELEKSKQEINIVGE